MHEVEAFSLFTEHDIYLFKEGQHFKLYEKFGVWGGTRLGVTYF